MELYQPHCLCIIWKAARYYIYIIYTLSTHYLDYDKYIDWKNNVFSI